MWYYDVVVVGAGPAGSAVAHRTAEAGLKVLVLEEHPEVGRPLQCSGLVTPRTLEELGHGAENLVVNRIKGAFVNGPGGARLRLGGDRVRAVALDRTRMDEMLAQRALDAGAELWLGSRLTGIERNSGYLDLTVRNSSGRGETTVQAGVLIGADGWNSAVARWIGFPPGPLIASVSVDVEMPSHSKDMAQVFVGNDVAPGWFCWTIPLGGGVVRVGAGCDSSRTTVKPRYLLESMLERVQAGDRVSEMVIHVGGFIPLYQRAEPPARTSADNVMLVGDAARQVKPTSGGGIYSSLVAARHAADAAIAAATKGDFSAEVLEVYERGWRGELEAEFERGADVRNLFLQLNDQQLERILKLLRLPGLQRIIRHYGDIDFQSPLYAQLFRALPVLGKLLSLPDLLPVRWTPVLGDTEQPWPVAADGHHQEAEGSMETKEQRSGVGSSGDS